MTFRNLNSASLIFILFSLNLSIYDQAYYFIAGKVSKLLCYPETTFPHYRANRFYLICLEVLIGSLISIWTVVVESSEICNHVSNLLNAKSLQFFCWLQFTEFAYFATGKQGFENVP